MKNISIEVEKKDLSLDDSIPLSKMSGTAEVVAGTDLNSGSGSSIKVAVKTKRQTQVA